MRRDETRRDEKRQQLTIRGKITTDSKRIDEMTREKTRSIEKRIYVKKRLLETRRPKTPRQQTRQEYQ